MWYGGFSYPNQITLTSKLRRNKIDRDKVSIAKLSMTVAELFFKYLIVGYRFKFNSFIIILIIIKIELSAALNNENSSFSFKSNEK